MATFNFENGPLVSISKNQANRRYNIFLKIGSIPFSTARLDLGGNIVEYDLFLFGLVDIYIHSRFDAILAIARIKKQTLVSASEN